MLAFLLGVLFFQINFFYEKAEKNRKQEFIVFQQAKKSVFVNRIKDKVFVYQNFDSLNVPVPRPVKNYVMANNKLIIQAQNPLKNYFEINSKSILVIDSLGIYKDLRIHPEIVILTQSPKINMQRLIEILQPKIIVADGSNYKSYVKLWENTGKNNSIYFHDTSVKGAFVTIY
jgi:competence protein ComEC